MAHFEWRLSVRLLTLLGQSVVYNWDQVSMNANALFRRKTCHTYSIPGQQHIDDMTWRINNDVHRNTRIHRSIQNGQSNYKEIHCLTMIHVNIHKTTQICMKLQRYTRIYTLVQWRPNYLLQSGTLSHYIVKGRTFWYYIVKFHTFLHHIVKRRTFLHHIVKDRTFSYLIVKFHCLRSLPTQSKNSCK